MPGCGILKESSKRNSMAKWQLVLGFIVILLAVGLIAFLYGKNGNTTIPEYEEKIAILEIEKDGLEQKVAEEEAHVKDIAKEMKRIKKQYDKIKYRTNFIDAMGDMYPVP